MELLHEHPKRKVMILTPCYDGRVDVWYANSLTHTLKKSLKEEIEIVPMWVSFDALIQRARNDSIHIALQADVDDVIWIDSDIEWDPDHFFKLLEYKEDVVGGTYRKKGDVEEYVLRQISTRTRDPETGLLEVEGLGTGFVKMSKKAIQYLWDVSEPYIDPKDDQERRLIFDIKLVDGGLMSEDINAFCKLTDGGFKLWLDPEITCSHIGPYKFQGDFIKWNYGQNIVTATGTKSEVKRTLPAVQPSMVTTAQANPLRNTPTVSPVSNNTVARTILPPVNKYRQL